MGDKRYKVLIVEDEPPISVMVARNLRLEGYLVETAQNGEKALSMIPEVNPDLILLDVMLPGIDGWEILTRLKEGPSTRDIPVIMLTGLSDEESKVQGLRGGADDFVTKPFSTLELMARVEAVLKRSGKNTRTGQERPQIPARKEDRILLIAVDEINYFNVQKEYTYLHTDEDRYLTNYTLSELARMLDPLKFFRAHRGYIVNLQKVSAISKLGSSSFELTMNDPLHTRIPMSRRQSSELRKILDL